LEEELVKDVVCVRFFLNCTANTLLASSRIGRRHPNRTSNWHCEMEMWPCDTG